jgi:hypothetical protein
MTEITAPQSKVILAEASGEIAAIVPQPQVVVVEVRRGPVGPTGAVDFPDGAATGDIIRWNAITSSWESKAEPLEFRGIVLVPMALPGAPVDGMVGFNIADNSLYVAVP